MPNHELDLLFTDLDAAIARFGRAGRDATEGRRSIHEVLATAYSIEEGVKRLDRSVYKALRAADDEGRATAGLIYMRGKLVHALITLHEGADLAASGTTFPSEHLAPDYNWWWREWADLATELRDRGGDPDARHAERFVAGRLIAQTIARARAFLYYAYRTLDPGALTSQ